MAEKFILVLKMVNTSRWPMYSVMKIYLDYENQIEKELGEIIKIYGITASDNGYLGEKSILTHVYFYYDKAFDGRHAKAAGYVEQQMNKILAEYATSNNREELESDYRELCKALLEESQKALGWWVKEHIEKVDLNRWRLPLQALKKDNQGHGSHMGNYS